MNYKDNYFGVLLNAVSQLGNAVCGGGNDISISARIGYHQLHSKSFFYKVCGWIVDNTFYPLDGKGHCVTAYVNDPHEDYQISKGFKVMEYITLVLLWLFCIPLAVIFLAYQLIKLIKKIDKDVKEEIQSSAVGGRPNDRKGGDD